MDKHFNNIQQYKANIQENLTESELNKILQNATKCNNHHFSIISPSFFHHFSIIFPSFFHHFCNKTTVTIWNRMLTYSYLTPWIQSFTSNNSEPLFIWYWTMTQTAWKLVQCWRKVWQKVCIKTSNFMMQPLKTLLTASRTRLKYMQPCRVTLIWQW